eukprot:2640098-Rhodomonas_salina.2
MQWKPLKCTRGSGGQRQPDDIMPATALQLLVPAVDAACTPKFWNSLLWIAKDQLTSLNASVRYKGVADKIKPAFPVQFPQLCAKLDTEKCTTSCGTDTYIRSP